MAYNFFVLYTTVFLLYGCQTVIKSEMCAKSGEIWPNGSGDMAKWIFQISKKWPTGGCFHEIFNPCVEFSNHCKEWLLQTSDHLHSDFWPPQNTETTKKMGSKFKKWPKKCSKFGIFWVWRPITSKPLKKIAPKFLYFYSGLSPFSHVVDSPYNAHGTGKKIGKFLVKIPNFC